MADNVSLLDRTSTTSNGGTAPKTPAGPNEVPSPTPGGIKPPEEIKVKPFINQDGYNQKTIDVEKPTMDEETTVESRIASLLDKNSDLMKRAGNFGDLRANASGALSSSMASRAAQSSLYDVATPIASKDADTAAQFKSLGFQYDSTLGQMNEQQKLQFESMDKQHSFSQEILKNTQDFKRWTQENDWSQDLTKAMMSMYTSLGSTALSGVAGMAGSQQVTDQEGKDFMTAWKDLQSSLAVISTLPITFKD